MKFKKIKNLIESNKINTIMYIWTEPYLYRWWRLKSILTDIKKRAGVVNLFVGFIVFWVVATHNSTI